MAFHIKNQIPEYSLSLANSPQNSVVLIIMSKVVILAINAKYVHSSLSVWVLAGGVSRYARLPHNVEIVEANINQHNDEIVEQVATYKPDVVGISTYIWNAGKLPGVLALLRERLPKAAIVLGGPEVSHNAGYWLDDADFVLRGEGERSFPVLLDMLDMLVDNPAPDNPIQNNLGYDHSTNDIPARENSVYGNPTNDDPVRDNSVYDNPMKDIPTRDNIVYSNPMKDSLVRGSLAYDYTELESIPGLGWRQNGEMFINPEAEPSEDFIDPYSEAFFIALKGRIAYIETSRGCPFKCAFCLSGGESGVRFFPLEAAKEQLRKLSTSGARTVKFVDRTFNCNVERAHELFQYVIDLATDCVFHFEAAPDLFDERTLSLLSIAPPGRIQLEAGLQSFFEPALKASSRQADLAKAEQNIRTLLRGRNIHIHVDLIAGLPYETLTEFQDSFDHAYALGAHTLQLGFLKLLHGSALRERQKSIIYSESPPYEIIRSPWLSTEDLEILKKTENALQHSYNKGRFLSTLRYVLSVSGLRPFSLYRSLGEAAINHGTPLATYAKQIYDHFVKLPGVVSDRLRDHMICDWLGAVKGNNRPPFLKTDNRWLKQVMAIAEELLGHRISRCETAVLSSGKTVFVDSLSRDPVTGLYRLHYVEPLSY